MPSVSSRPVMILACAIPDAVKTTFHGSSAIIPPFFSISPGGFSYSETFEKWLRRGSKIFSAKRTYRYNHDTLHTVNVRGT
jgi:hypothetical protein